MRRSAKIGLKGMRVKFNGQLQRTRVEDPISGEMRNFSRLLSRLGMERRIPPRPQAISPTASPSTIADEFTFFRTDEFDTNFNGGPYGTAFVEYRPRAGTTITLDLDNAFDTSGNRNRLLFIPNRARPDFVIDEFRERNRHLNFGLTLKQSFGGGAACSGVAQAQLARLKGGRDTHPFLAETISGRACHPAVRLGGSVRPRRTS